MVINVDLPMTKQENNLDLALIMCPAWGVEQPPLGISYLKSFLGNFGIKVKCFDLSVELYKIFPEKKYWDLNYPEYFITSSLFENDILPVLTPYIDIWVRRILNFNPQAVGFSLFMSSANASLALARRFKEISPDLKIIGGGPEVARMKRILVDGVRRFASLNMGFIAGNIFDVLVDGEGEEALLEILSLIKEGRDSHSVKGTLCIEEGRFIASEPRGLMGNLDALPPPDYSDFELSSYTKTALPLVTSRGCVNRCTFCADSPLWKTYRYRSPESVLGEMKYLIKRYGINNFEITDSTFNGDIKRLSTICDLIIESKLNIQWSAKVTLRKEMSYKLLRKMREAGCFSLGCGVESGSPRVLKDMRKNIDLTEAKRILRDIWRARIQANCFFIIGYPIETEKDFQMTLDFIRKNARFIHCFDQVTGCHIEEDSYIGLNLDEYGIVLKEDGWHSKESTPQIRKERLERFRELVRRLHRHYQCEVQL